ncbi:hypothetical protein GQ602_006974 [Ophiocordyceps camponoti-floridani]|uniref:Cytochrome P450 n=1 Tax=Ophiocordyceps camponoti-floridani TaxID=2030778 RepID=A0A8H4Q0I5_9HYPO|nr:hypothetical protein GQ602_006974 [Ophiocordyceps camponoti-floridani]
MMYGYNIKRGGDPLVSLHERMMRFFGQANVPLNWAVDVIPLLKYLPEGFPGSSFKKTARVYKKVRDASVGIPYSFCRRTTAESQRHSFVSATVEMLGGESEISPENEAEMELSAWASSVAGSDTLVTTIQSVVLALVMFPEVQRKAHDEIDRVVGSKRLPGLEDRKNMPYIEAVAKEAFRWETVAPMGLPRLATEDLTYEGYLIPKGTILLPAIRWFLHDPDTYKDPESFKPARYLDPLNEPDPSFAAFGYGRRKCPGMAYANRLVFLTISRMLAVFDFSKAVDDNGIEIEVEAKAIPGLALHLETFPCHVRPRSVERAELVKNLCAGHDREESDDKAVQQAVREAMGGQWH